MISSVLHVTNVHPPLDIRIYSKECRSLAAAGFEVTLVAPNAPDGPIDGVSFIPLPQSTGGRLRRMLLGNVRLFRLVFGTKADVVHFHDPELFFLALALRCTGRRVIYDAHEHVRDDIRSKPYLGRFSRPLLLAAVGSLEWLVVRVVTRVVAATPKIASQFPVRKTVVVHNYPILDELPSAGFELDEYQARRPVGLYAGALTRLRHANEMFAAADAVKDSRPEFSMVVAGTAAAEVDAPGSHRGVEYLGTIAREEVAGLLRSTRFGVMLLADAPNCSDGLPTKFFEYAAAGLPVIVSRSTHSIAEIVHEAGCGIAVDERSAAEIAAAMRRLIEDVDEAYRMGQRGGEAIHSRYGWAAEAEKLVALYRTIG